MKKLLNAIALAVATLGASTAANAGIVLSFTPSSSHVDVGQDVTITASISGLGPEVLSGFDLNFVYTPALLDWQLITFFGGVLGPHHDSGAGEPSGGGVVNGNIGYWGNSLEDDSYLQANQADSFDLFQFTLRGKVDGTTDFTLGPDADFNRLFVGLNFGTLDVSIGSACIAVGNASCDGNPVPEPASFGLAAIALLTAGAASRRRRKTVAA